MMAKRYHVSRHIDAPVERVWALLTDASSYRACHQPQVAHGGGCKRSCGVAPSHDGIGRGDPWNDGCQAWASRITAGVVSGPGQPEAQGVTEMSVGPATWTCQPRWRAIDRWLGAAGRGWGADVPRRSTRAVRLRP